MAPIFSRKKFTLIELLVVIAIIGILAALILPALNMVKRRSLLAKCQSNLRQIGIAMKAYGTSHNGVFPHTDRDSGSPTAANNYCWYDRLDDKYLSSTDSMVKQCPAEESVIEDGFSALNPVHSYKMNIGVGSPPWSDAPPPVDVVWDGAVVFDPGFKFDTPPGSRVKYFPRESLVKNPGSLVLAFDAKASDDTTGTPGLAYWERHDGVINLLMFDCSVFQYTPPDTHKDPDGTLSTDDLSNYGVVYTFRSKR